MILRDTVFLSRNTLVYAHTTWRMLLPCDMSLGSLTIAMSEAEDCEIIRIKLLKVWKITLQCCERKLIVGNICSFADLLQ
jgi:hypothetical protein